ncbi:hypothetical protein BJF93_00435 [Xaviernesmea oryzae]|uniref:Lipoprotein n=1 Tax=Xaviernesmea oryzae TaxID=464029 RepID=A0A1Q9B0D7_9HYPH|nr:hypothetical protein [Xaviernesmea oryzae]OLP61440.1 hypothetical protein BJF93_00435 [Xaviernesmea oryzae]SEL69158.1 hypothetical protein SAMN04487976_11197 [Xaviernesmea oryzae]
MKTLLQACSAALSAALISGCATHPLPDAVTDDTVTIVNKVRCEAGDAVIIAMAAHLEKTGYNEDAKFARKLKLKRATAAELMEPDGSGKISRIALNYFKKYVRGVIVYDFDLDIENERTHGFGVTKVSENLRRAFDYKVGGSLDLKHQARRQFRILDKFSDLVALYKNNQCSSSVPLSPNYPIAGKIGLLESIKTFIAINDGAKVEAGADRKANVTNYTDELTFTTLRKGNADPTVVFIAGAAAKLTTNLDWTNSFSRQDTHKIIFSIEIPLQENDALEDQKKTIARAQNRSSGEPSSVTPNSPAARAIQNLNEKYRRDYYLKLDEL